LEQTLTCHTPNMLRLQPSEIAVTPEDVRTVNDRLDARKKAKARVKLHPGPERSRDDAITTRSHQLHVSSRRADVSTDEDGSEEQTASSQTRVRIGLDPSPPQAQQGPALTLSRGLPLPASMATLRSQASFTAPHDRPILPIRLEPSEGSSTGTTSVIMPLQAQFDGQVDAIPFRDTSANHGKLRNTSNSSLILQSRTLSAPMIPQVTVQAPTPRVHVRQPLSDGAIAFDGDRRNERRYRLLRATTVEAGPSTVSPFGAGSVHALTQRVMRMSFNSPPRLGAPSHSPSPRDPESLAPPPRPENLRSGPRRNARYPNTPNEDLEHASRSETMPLSFRSLSSASSDSSAAEAAETGRLSPLESISRQAAIVHSRLASRQRSRRSSDQGLSRPQPVSGSEVTFFQRHIDPSFQRPGLPGEPFDLQLRDGRVIYWCDRRRTGYTSWHTDLLTMEEVIALELEPSPALYSNVRAHRTLMVQYHDEMGRLSRSATVHPIGSIKDNGHTRAETSRTAELRPSLARLPIPERHSSRDIRILPLGSASMLNDAQVSTH
jgi:hypothetical protein